MVTGNQQASLLSGYTFQYATMTASPMIHTFQDVNLSRLIQFFQRYLPPKVGDVPFLYHLPTTTHFDLSTSIVKKVVLSITPTKGVYDALHTRPVSVTRHDHNLSTVCFLHRPFDLDRYRVPRQHGVVLASHKSLDEVLTTGWNVQLARRLHIDLNPCLCIRGYKGDPDRRIGLVGGVHNATEGTLCNAVWQEFGGWEGCYGFSDVVPMNTPPQLQLNEPIKVVAIMNAFHPEEIERVAEAAVKGGFIADADACHELLYLTGAVREAGLQAALAKGMRVVCVGHKICEDWGIKFLASEVRSHFPGLEVVEVDEPEEPRMRGSKVQQDVIAESGVTCYI